MAFAEQLARLRGVFLKPEHLNLLDEAEALHAGLATPTARFRRLRELVMYEAALLEMAPTERFRRDGAAGPMRRLRDGQ
jgi:flagellar protein FlbT